MGTRAGRASKAESKGGRKAAVASARKALNPKQRAFVSEYLKDKNATKAAARAGYSAATAGQIGHRLLKNVQIAESIEQAHEQQIAQVQAETGITLERTLREIAKGAFFDPRKFFTDGGSLKPITELDDISAAALAGFEITEVGGRGKDSVMSFVNKAKLADRKGYLDMLMKHLGGYKADNEQTSTPLAEALQAFVGSLHQAGARLPIKPRT